MTIPVVELLVGGFIGALAFPIDYGIGRWRRTREAKRLDRELEQLFADASKDR